MTKITLVLNYPYCLVNLMDNPLKNWQIAYVIVRSRSFESEMLLIGGNITGNE